MNERILELARKSADGLLSYSAEGCWLLSEKEVNKFAELIVRECADVCYQIDHEYDGEDILATWCAKGILEYFGIKP